MANLEQLIKELETLHWLEERERRRVLLREELCGISDYLRGTVAHHQPEATSLL